MLRALDRQSGDKLGCERLPKQNVSVKSDAKKRFYHCYFAGFCGALGAAGTSFDFGMTRDLLSTLSTIERFRSLL